ncbi:MAG: NAD-glutamate dehydrogenase, partial [Comamonadaceae bacterium]
PEDDRLCGRRRSARRAPASDLIDYLPADRDAHTAPTLLVVTDDMPLLVDTLTAVVESAGAAIAHLLHPVIPVVRAQDGTLTKIALGAGAPEGTVIESWIRIEFAAAPSDLTCEQIFDSVRQTFVTLRRITTDAPAMLAQQQVLADALDKACESDEAHRAEDELADTAALLRWLGGGNFTLLGYHYSGGASGSDHAPIRRALGVYCTDAGDLQTHPSLLQEGNSLLTVAQAPKFPEVRHGLDPHLVIISEMDGGVVVGVHHFVGLFTVSALHENVLDIPVLARRARAVIARAGYRLESHSGQGLLEIIQDYPRPELFSIDADALYRTVLSVLRAAAREQLLLLLRPPPGNLHVSALVYLPGDRYTTGARVAMQDVLHDEFPGSNIDHTVRVTESVLALVHFTIHLASKCDTDAVGDWAMAQKRVQRRLAAVARTWD